MIAITGVLIFISTRINVVNRENKITLTRVNRKAIKFK
ncbi:hypothetical protein RINTHH_280 [Richelia intracellularis HH01]|uniref:Uncharacterized protein n=1 Tax=Richelia intracellularis HH01 TaxID=1165094 RepID=M1WYT3_9NOST|nr:hypothetical protein RINTHH_280 [Richelia intracellularis HH01]